MPKRIVARYGCGCRVSCSYGSYSIAYCPKHKAAPDMYEALMKFPHHVTTGDYTAEEIQQLIRKWRNSHCCEALIKPTQGGNMPGCTDALIVGPSSLKGS